MPHTKINGVDIYFEQHGDSGEPLLLVHGYTGDVTDWRFQVPEFSRTHRVAMLDLRGHGRSEAPTDRDAYSIDQMADDVQAFADFLGLDGYHLVGHSMGGAIAQEMTLRSPGRLISLILHDTGFAFDLARNEMVAKYLQIRNDVAEKQGMAALAAMPSPYPPPPFMPPEREAETRDRLAAMSVDAFLGAGVGLRSWAGTHDRLTSIQARTMVIYGDLDNPLLVSAAQHMAATIPGATLEVVPQAGHSPQYERPELFNAALRKHLEAGAATAK